MVDTAAIWQPRRMASAVSGVTASELAIESAAVGSLVAIRATTLRLPATTATPISSMLGKSCSKPSRNESASKVSTVASTVKLAVTIEHAMLASLRHTSDDGASGNGSGGTGGEDCGGAGGGAGGGNGGAVGGVHGIGFSDTAGEDESGGEGSGNGGGAGGGAGGGNGGAVGDADGGGSWGVSNDGSSGGGESKGDGSGGEGEVDIDGCSGGGGPMRDGSNGCCGDVGAFGQSTKCTPRHFAGVKWWSRVQKCTALTTSGSSQ